MGDDPGRDPGRLHSERTSRSPGAERSPAAPEAPALERLASSVGNRNFTALARMPAGGGILHDGTVHPAVQSAIAARAGSGAPLDRQVADQLGASIGPMHDVSVHTGPEADVLARAVDARAFVVGTDMYFAQGEYAPRTPRGRELIAHESVHVQQQRNAPASGPLVVSNPGDALEVEADAIAGDALA